MTARAISYGAVELKQMAHTYWLTGFGISVAIHLCILVASFLAGAADVTTISSSEPVSGEKYIQVRLNYIPYVPFNPGIVPAAAPGSHVVLKGATGTPEPVPDNPIVLDQTILSQHEMGQLADPQGGASGRGEVTPQTSDEAEPPEFLVVERQPVLLERVVPVYPEVAVKAGLEGDVWVKMWVDRTGKVRKAEVIKSNSDIFNEAALEAARRWAFIPACMNSGPVSVWVSAPFKFRLRDKAE